MQIIEKELSWLKPYAKNPRDNASAVEPVANSIKEFGFKVPIVATSDGEIINGHTRFKASKLLGLEKVPVIIADDLTDEQIKAFRLADNKTGELANWDFSLLDEELSDIVDLDMSDFGFEIDDFMTTEQKIKENDYSGSLIDDFMFMPMSIIDTRKGEWQSRKKMWKELGIASEVGRGDNLTFARSLSTGNLTGTSIFDPVLCELMYKWFTPREGSIIIDPFAGGSVRGVVAEQCGYQYRGIELRK